MVHDYFYGVESEQFAFIRVPRLLFTDKAYRRLSLESKILYGLLLERMSLSQKNGWLDEYDRVYIIYPIEEIREQLGCCHEKAVKLLAELDAGKGFGLIERVRRGLGQADIIYVKNFADMGEEDEENTSPESSVQTQKEPKKPYLSKKSEKPTSGYRKNRLLEVGKTDIKTSEKPTSGHRKIRLLDIGKTDTSKTNNNYTYGNHTESNPSIDRSINGYDDRISRDQVKIIREKVKQQIEFDVLVEECNSGMLNEVVNIMTKVLCSTAKALRIGGVEVPIALVRDAYLRLCPSDIESVIAAYMALEEPVQNPTGYMTSMLYHAPDSGILMATNMAKSRKDG